MINDPTHRHFEVFASFSDSDKGIIEPLIDILRSGPLAFRVEEGIPKGVEWHVEISAEIEPCRLIWVFWCSHALNSEKVRRDYQRGIELKKSIIPILLDSTPLPKELSKFPYIDFRIILGSHEDLVNHTLPISRKGWGMAKVGGDKGEWSKDDGLSYILHELRVPPPTAIKSASDELQSWLGKYVAAAGRSAGLGTSESVGEQVHSEQEQKHARKDVEYIKPSDTVDISEQPARHVNFIFTKPQKRRILPLNEGFLSGKLYVLEVSIGATPDIRYREEGHQPEIQRPETEEQTVDLYVAIFEQGSNLSIVEKRLDIIKWPATGPSRANAKFKLQAKETAEECSSILDVYIYHKTNLIYEASFKITIQPSDYAWKKDESPITWVYNEEKFPTELFHNFTDLKELSERALNLIIQAADGKNEFILTAFIGRAAFPARVTMEREELIDILIKMRKQMDDWRKESVYLDGGFDLRRNYVGDYIGKKEGGYNKEGQQNKGAANTLFETCMVKMAELGSKFYDSLFSTEDGIALREIIETTLHEGDVIQIWIDRDATDFVFPWAWMYGETVDPGKRFKYRNELFWGYKYVIEQRPQFPETIGESLSAKIQSAHLDIKVGIHRFEPTTKIQEQYFGNLSKKSPRHIKYEVWDDDTRWELFFPKCNSDILYFFSHGHTAKPITPDGQQFYEMTKHFKDWLTQSSPGESEEVGHHRKQAEEYLKEIEANSELLGETFILLQHGYLLWRELNKLANLKATAPLVFLNMCESAQVFPSMSKGFVDVFLKKGARGVIGTEIPMIDSFADLFAREFFDAFLYAQDKSKNPVSVGKVLFDLRRRFLDMGNPLGFAYTFYGDASTRLSQSLPKGS